MLFLSSSIVCLKITGSRHSSCPQLALNRNLLCKRFLCKSVSGLCVYACACAHNYRCAILPKAVIKKGMGMTPTTTTAWGYVTSSSWILSYPGDSWNLSCTAGCPWKCSPFKPRRSLVFFPTSILSLILAERKKTRSGVFMSLSCSLGRVRARFHCCFGVCPCEGAVSPTLSFILRCWWSTDKREDGI